MANQQLGATLQQMQGLLAQMVQIISKHPCDNSILTAKFTGGSSSSSSTVGSSSSHALEGYF